MRAIIARYLAKDEAARILQVSGILRFVLILLQGVLLVQAGVPIMIVGQLELVFFVANFLQFFWQNGGHQAMMSWKSGDERLLAAGSIFGGMHMQAAAGVLLLWFIALLPIGEQYTFLMTLSNLLALSAYIFFSIPVGAIVYVFLVGKKYRQILWYTGLSYGIQVGVVLWFLIQGLDVSSLLSALAVFALVRWLVILVLGGWFKNSRGLRGSWTFFVFALPLVLHAFYGGIMDYVDGWIVSLFFGEESFAYYRFGARELPLNTMLIGGLVTGLVHQYQSGQGVVDSVRLKSETERLIRILLPLSCILVLISPLLYPLLYNDEFILSARIFNIYTLTIVARVILNQVYCYVNHRNWVLTWSTAVEIVVNIALSIIFMRWIGLPGIPAATVVAYVLQKGFLIIYVHRQFNVRFSDYMPVKLCAIYTATLMICVILAELIYF